MKLLYYEISSISHTIKCIYHILYILNSLCVREAIAEVMIVMLQDAVVKETIFKKCYTGDVLTIKSNKIGVDIVCSGQ